MSFGRACVVLFCLGAIVCLCKITWGQDYFNPANGHVYRLIRFPEVTWETARLEAINETLGGVPGHLATITSADEQAFITSKIQPAVLPFGVWLGGFQPPGSPEPSGNWQWVTGEPFTFTNWAPAGEPNDDGDEKYLQLFWDSYWWNDLGDEFGGSPLEELPYLVEFSVPEPAAPLIALSGIACHAFASCRRRRD